MTTWIALLRGVNVGGKTLRMETLRETLAALGMEAVKTYIQSGNAVFRCSESDGNALRKHLEQGITENLEVVVSLLLRSPAELEALLSASSFELADVSSLYYTFLEKSPETGLTETLPSPQAGFDEFRIIGREIHLHCPGGYGRTVYSNQYFERKLKQIATTRNRNTVLKLLEMCR